MSALADQRLTDRPTHREYAVTEDNSGAPQGTATNNEPASHRPSRRSRLRRRLAATPAWVRWRAATVLALLLILGIGAGGFAVGSELAGGDGGHGSEHGGRGGGGNGGGGDKEGSDRGGNDHGERSGNQGGNSEDEESSPTPRPTTPR